MKKQISYHDGIERYYLNAGDLERLNDGEEIDILTTDNRHIKLIYEDDEDE